MAAPPLLQLSGISLSFGGEPLFDGLDLVVQPRDRVALVGRNGSGKSTLLKIVAGLVDPDAGSRTVAPGGGVGYMEQDPDLSGHATLGDYAASGLAPGEAYRVEMAAEGLNLSPDAEVATASGGERRRAALAKLLAEAPDLMLLDEPTNHLDITAIRWLESQLARTQAAFVLISHDRAFLTALTEATLWVDRGTVRRQERGFAGFEAWRDKVWEEEDAARHKLDRKIREEARWAVEGISARRKRNQGRVRALQAMRAERAAQIGRHGKADFALEEGQASGKRVIEARGIAKRYGDKVVLRPFDLRVLRGDRVALVGPNGAGKTTLLKLLTGEVEPDAGTVTLGTGVELAVFDQNRAQLDPEATLWDTLVQDPTMGGSGQADQIMVRGTPRHVVGYLKDFLFDERQARAPVRSLSGGETARLLLARIMARPSNLLVLDEPTNDLDVETLDLLQDVLGEYPGTVLLVSHDRDFIDRVATTTVALACDGRAVVHAGGWSDYQRSRAASIESPPASRSRSPGKSTGMSTGQPDAKVAAAAEGGLSFTERHRLQKLPAEIARLEAEIAKIETFLSDPDLYTTAPAKFEKATDALVTRQEALAAAEDEWLELESRAQAAG